MNPEQRLGLAVIAQAINDLRSGDRGCAELFWGSSGLLEFYCAVAGLDREAVQQAAGSAIRSTRKAKRVDAELLRDPERTNCEIAADIGVGAELVRRRRVWMEAGGRLGPRQSTRGRIEEYVRQHPGETDREIARGLGLRRDAVRYHLAALSREHRLTREGRPFRYRRAA